MANVNAEDRAALIAVLKVVVDSILATVKEEHDRSGEGAPTVSLHMALEQSGLRHFDHREKVLDLAVATGKVRRVGHTMVWVGD